MTIECKEIDWLCKQRKKVRSSQGAVSMNSCTELSKTHFFPVSIVKKYQLELIKIWWKFMKRIFQWALNISPMINIFRKVWADKNLIKEFAYRITENNCRSRLFASKEVSYLLDKKSSLTWRTFIISSPNFSCELQERTPCEISHYVAPSLKHIFVYLTHLIRVV